MTTVFSGVGFLLPSQLKVISCKSRLAPSCIPFLMQPWLASFLSPFFFWQRLSVAVLC